MAGIKYGLVLQVGTVHCNITFPACKYTCMCWYKKGERDGDAIGLHLERERLQQHIIAAPVVCWPGYIVWYIIFPNSTDMVSWWCHWITTGLSKTKLTYIMLYKHMKHWKVYCCAYQQDTGSMPSVFLLLGYCTVDHIAYLTNINAHTHTHTRRVLSNNQQHIKWTGLCT